MLLFTEVQKILGINVKLNIFPGLNQLYVNQKGMGKKGEEKYLNFRKTDADSEKVGKMTS